MVNLQDKDLIECVNFIDITITGFKLLEQNNHIEMMTKFLKRIKAHLERQLYGETPEVVDITKDIKEMKVEGGKDEKTL